MMGEDHGVQRGAPGSRLPDADENRASLEGAHPRLLYRLLKLSNLIGRPFFTHFAERYDLTMNDLRVLMTLGSMSEAASHELCRAIGMHPMNVSRAVARLRRQGRIAERWDPANRRRKILAPTPEGWALYHKLTPHVTVLSEFLFGSLSALEADFLGKLLEVLVQRLEAVDLNSPKLIDVEALARDIEAEVPGATQRRRRRGAADPAAAGAQP